MESMSQRRTSLFFGQQNQRRIGAKLNSLSNLLLGRTSPRSPFPPFSTTGVTCFFPPFDRSTSPSFLNLAAADPENLITGKYYPDFIRGIIQWSCEVSAICILSMPLKAA
uniref:Uncharacterized protein n=1 Tax=Cucumis sativus TaxID=3659 RepID=A0A0A0LL10_CUCSA